jgi:molecular chaperone DnaK
VGRRASGAAGRPATAGWRGAGGGIESPQMSDEHRRDPRTPAELRIRLALGSMDAFVERYALNVSLGGIFVRTRDPQPPGTVVELEVSLDNGEVIIRGQGMVRWTTPPSAPGEQGREPGMGVKFLELTRESRALVDLAAATRGAAGRSDEPPLPEGEEPAEELDFDVEDLSSLPLSAPPPAAAPAAAEAPRPAAPAAPRAQPAGAKVIGIDLGTTNSCAAFVRGGRVEMLSSRQGYRTLPSVVAYDAQGRLLVGQAAKAQMVVNPRNTVYGSKRLVGRPYASPTVQACRDRFHYEIVEGEGGTAAVRFAGRDFTLQQVSALVLREIRELASQALGGPVERAVITVPAYYNDHQRSAVREAGRLAGLSVERIVNEPTAAALAFGHGKGLDERVLVYDLGGGTFDASVLEIQGDVYEVVSTGGDTFLGGVDFDAQLVDHLVYRFMEQHGFTPPEDRVVWQRIRDAAEATKVALSERESAVAHVPYLCRSPQGASVELKVEVSRLELEELTGRLVDRTIEVCREVLAARSLSIADIQQVLLVGGQSRMPLVWRRIREAFGREPSKAVHPDEAVALGAALLADSASRIDSVVLIDVLAMGIGIGLPGGRLAPVLPRNTRLPARRSYEHATTRDGQTELELQVFQGDSARVTECEYLGTVWVPNLPPRPRGLVRVAVEFALGAEGILTVTARELGSGRVTEAHFATRDTPESLKAKLQLPEPQTAPPGARPLEVGRATPPPPSPASPAPSPQERPRHPGLFARLLGRRR